MERLVISILQYNNIYSTSDPGLRASCPGRISFLSPRVVLQTRPTPTFLIIAQASTNKETF